MRKRSFRLVAGACLAALSLTAGSALADPQPPFRVVQGVGSGITEDVLNGYGNGSPTTCSPGEQPPDFPGIGINPVNCTGTKIVASWDANTVPLTVPPPPPLITTRATGCANIPRPDGSIAGVDALAGRNPDFPAACADFARTAIDDHSNRTGQGLTYIPFAQDRITYATLTQSTIPSDLTIEDLKTIYTANGVPGVATGIPGNDCFGFTPLLPRPGSDTREIFLTALMIHDRNQPATPQRPLALGTCVRDETDPNCPPSVPPTTPPSGPKFIPENSGCAFGGRGFEPPPLGTRQDTKLMPFGVGGWICQSFAYCADRRGLAVLRGIGKTSPFDPRPDIWPPVLSPMLFNVVRTADLNNPALRSTLIGVFGPVNPAHGDPPGQICSHPEVLKKFGHTDKPNCGDTTIVTSSN